jgi:hypothetical protein
VTVDQGFESLVVVCVALAIPVLSDPVPEFGRNRADCGATDGHYERLLTPDKYIYREFAIANMADSDETASVLTPAQRDYFLGTREMSESGERALRRRVRKRITSGMGDLSLLTQRLTRSDYEQALKDVRQADSLAFFFREHAHTLFPEPAPGYPSTDEVKKIEEAFGMEPVQNSGAPRDSNLSSLQTQIENALLQAIRAEAPERITSRLQDYEIHIDVDLSVRFSKLERLSVMELEYQLQNEDLSFREIRQYYADGKISLTELQQLTRGEEATGEPTPERRKQLLSDPIPMLEGEPPEGYVRIKNSNTATRRLHEREIMPEGYQIRFDEQGEAVVLEDIGKRAVERFDTIELITYN